ncbi:MULTISPECIES: DUF4326 domain-containing protein [Streptomyces]|uniref:DUF4326 domain-containing protein n=1 Tax=Streptomyces TaxID=1883 RepID=UPI000B9E1033|nr:DUF4326 domain-containing protein [Streptomyces kasugaensis]
MPVRLHGSARTALRLPATCIYVGKGSRYANPFRTGDASPSVHRTPMTAQEAVELFAATLRGPVGRCYAEQFARALHGLDLVCTCPLDAPCHADVLLCLANEAAPNRTTCSLEGPAR